MSATRHDNGGSGSGSGFGIERLPGCESGYYLVTNGMDYC